MEYIIYCKKWPCGGGAIIDPFYIPNTNEGWLRFKPSHGVDLNAVYKALEALSKCHTKCGCIFEVMPV